MSHPSSDPDLVRRFMNRPPHTAASPGTSSNGLESRTPFGEKKTTSSATIPADSRSRLAATTNGWQQSWPGSENASPVMSPKHAFSGRASAAAFDQENESQYSRTRSRTIEPEEYEQTRKKLKDTQYELSSTKTELEQKIVTMEKTAREADIFKKKLMTRIDSLESDRRFLYEQERSLTKKVQDLEEGSIEFKMTSNELTKNLRDENLDLKERFAQLREQSRATESELSHKVRTLTASLTHQQANLEETKGTSESQSSLAAEKHRQLEDAMSRILDLEDQNRQLRLNSQGLEDVARVERELKNQVTYIKQLEGTNRQLTTECKHYKEMYRNVEVLKEEKAGLEQKLKMLDELRIKCGKFEVQNGVLLKEKQQWAVFLERTDTTDFNSPYDLAKTVASLRGDKAALTELRGELEATVKARDAYIGQLEAQIRDLKKNLITQEEYCREQASVARRHERAKDLALRQVESFRQQLHSYDDEETKLMGGSYDQQKSIRIEQLEKLVQEYHDRLESAMAAASSNPTPGPSGTTESTSSRELLRAIEAENTSMYSRLNAEKGALFEAKQRLEKEIELLRHENESLDAKILQHELAIGAGAFNPATSRVLELKDSPASRHQAVRQHMLDSLKEENTALLETITQLHQQQQQQQVQPFRTDENGDQEVALRDEGMIPTASYNRLKEDHARLQEEMAEKAKLSKRMKQEWSLKAKEFLEAVRSLLGYKLTFHDSGRVELTSVYTTEEKQSFVFTSGLNDEGTMQLVGSGSQKYMDEHKESFDHWVNQLGSIPAFLSRVTLDLVEEQAQQLQQQQLQDQRLHLLQQYQHADDDNTQNSDMMMDM
ncbi:coiled-coil domain-containing protein mad1 [Mortierella antarctica]|nr:coiled-coil domain-containing protein mad1 [Mortierella antarctica]